MKMKNGKPIKLAGHQCGYPASIKMLIRQYNHTNVKTCVFGKFSDEFVGQSIGLNVINQGIVTDRSNYGRELYQMPIHNPNQVGGKTNERYVLNARTNHLHLGVPVANIARPFPQ